MKKIMMLGAAILAFQALPALAATDGATPPAGGKQHGKMFEAADTNKDGALSKEEYLAESKKHTEKRFDEIDTNKDGKITKDELKAHHDTMKAKHEKHKDAKPATDEAPKAE